VPSRRVAVAATGQQALAAGLGVAEDGGNAVDAALASAFVALATEPGIVSLGGGAYVAVWPAEGEPVVVDGNVEMPGRGGDPGRLGGGIRELVTAYGGGVTMSVGPGSVATPGIVPAFAVAAAQYAALPWARLVEPAAQAARSYPLGAAGATYLGYVADSLFAEDDEARGLVVGPEGAPPRAGQRCTNDALADTLVRLAEEGPDLFVHGDVGRALVAAMEDQGGLITADDLDAYHPVVRPAHRITVGEWEIATNPPPSVGGPMLAVMLGELAQRTRWTWDDAIEIQRRVLSYRTAVHDLSPDLEADGMDLLARVGREGLGALGRSSSTAHVSAVDSDGNACAVTMSSGYCAGLCIPGTGILLNNTLGEVELNRLGVHALRPGTRLASNMAPTTGRSTAEPSGERRPIAVGSPGADRITTALMLVLGQGCLHGRDLRHAIAAPRLHVRPRDEGFVVEHERDDEIAAAVARSGLPAHEYPEPHMYFGGVGAALATADGDLIAAGDARREAATGVSGEPGGLRDSDSDPLD
jgi:gamma-glutamyltranspeptidase / glutathione hydrolase